MLKRKWLKGLAMAMGVSCVGIGFLHMALGDAAVPGMNFSGVAADSQSRFFGAIFVGYGGAYIWAARQTPIAIPAIRWLSGILALGAVGRFISLAVHGSPHWFVYLLTASEVVLPPLFFWLSGPVEEAGSRAPSRLSTAS
ncbi:DUF4345 domain-containing protein [Nocardia arthritidis]|uniref:DUF4345 domain-containing protein n=1 Tax=Nocardia arthritidis TaxID=228602 RepID=A0A6G9YM87_9NOCA|nr:DUF4345 domain-containing protein [Nocardia arthritidis]QIS14301.1 DUF4345 domain-containing protein [Nocardia arthritidis]